MQLTINGEAREVNATTIETMLVALAVPLDRVAVELNGAIVRRQQRATTTLNDGDVVEVVTLVGGG